MIAQIGTSQVRLRHGTRSISLSGMKDAIAVIARAPSAAVKTNPYQYIAGEPPPSGGTRPSCQIPWIGMDLHDVGDTNHAGHHREITDRTEFEFIVQGRVDRICREHDQERVAVRRRAHHRFGSNVARGAWTVLDKERLTETLRQPLADQTRHDVDRAARGKPKNHTDRPHRIGLRAGCPRDGREGGGTCRHLQKSTAWKFHVPFTLIVATLQQCAAHRYDLSDRRL